MHPRESLQFVIALLTLKWPVGYKALNGMGDAVMKFLSFAEVGASFLYGDNYKDHYFAFVVLSITIFFGAFLGVLYHVGVVQASYSAEPSLVIPAANCQSMS